MGLESVELVMDVEDAFGIRVPDDLAEGVRTVGELAEAVLALVRTGGSPALAARPDLEAHVWQTVRRLAAKGARGVRPEDVTPATRFFEDLGYRG